METMVMESDKNCWTNNRLKFLLFQLLLLSLSSLLSFFLSPFCRQVGHFKRFWLIDHCDTFSWKSVQLFKNRNKRDEEKEREEGRINLHPFSTFSHLLYTPSLPLCLSPFKYLVLEEETCVGDKLHVTSIISLLERFPFCFVGFGDKNEPRHSFNELINLILSQTHPWSSLRTEGEQHSLSCWWCKLICQLIHLFRSEKHSSESERRIRGKDSKKWFWKLATNYVTFQSSFWAVFCQEITHHVSYQTRNCTKWNFCFLNYLKTCRKCSSSNRRETREWLPVLGFELIIITSILVITFITFNLSSSLQTLSYCWLKDCKCCYSMSRMGAERASHPVSRVPLQERIRRERAIGRVSEWFESGELNWSKEDGRERRESRRQLSLKRHLKEQKARNIIEVSRSIFWYKFLSLGIHSKEEGDRQNALEWKRTEREWEKSSKFSWRRRSDPVKDGLTFQSLFLSFLLYFGSGSTVNHWTHLVHLSIGHSFEVSKADPGTRYSNICLSRRMKGKEWILVHPSFHFFEVLNKKIEILKEKKNKAIFLFWNVLEGFHSVQFSSFLWKDCPLKWNDWTYWISWQYFLVCCAILG